MDTENAGRTLLRLVHAADVPQDRHQAYDEQTLSAAASILEDIRNKGETAVRDHAIRLGDLDSSQPLFYPRADLEKALDTLDKKDRDVLERVAGRIKTFAQAQKESLTPLSTDIPGGAAGHEVLPVECAGCYAPGGRYPLPSTVLMTVIPALVAGVQNVWVASPKPSPIIMGAAAIAGAHGLIAAGGAQAIGALAYGTDNTQRCDVIVGPGSRWVTAAKQLVAGDVVIDMLAGPSELAVLADDSAAPETIAADLLAQAEHDTDALPVLITTSQDLHSKVNEALARQLDTLPTAEAARIALKNGFTVLAENMDQAIESCNTIAAEHLEIMTRNPEEVAAKIKHCGGLFIGEQAAEVIGDYGAGPNHTLPTGGTARSRAGLSVFTFLRTRTWIRIDDPGAAKVIYEDSVSLARMEGLEAHARAAACRIIKG